MTLCQDIFAGEATHMAQLMGLSGLRLALVPCPRPGEKEAMETGAAAVVRSLLEGLLGRALPLGGNRGA